eukprot:CAMPEP_0174346116 /NCGR_PEP_ID=MMETSP0811_2-20130205/1680_1 /TAXON_ID=73025 ORGANISM="Eutreptiella gymnastica-like, Strain CCMP1594" /NCGR_SAMPLE_ID=MMETSP0811_2 /ASSEMBLY_ACC=CAM_ASM_000667 /LENGTH=64 /DNA_ID=CAMNT_0015470333 /DNA_START=389 /DNA_END=583 /DNA_ORIENTATION=+
MKSANVHLRSMASIQAGFDAIHQRSKKIWGTKPHSAAEVPPVSMSTLMILLATCTISMCTGLEK